MARDMYWACATGPRNHGTGYGHAAPFDRENLCCTRTKIGLIFFVSQGSSVPISGGGPPIL
jgi:hypothetical protein